MVAPAKSPSWQEPAAWSDSQKDESEEELKSTIRIRHNFNWGPVYSLIWDKIVIPFLFTAVIWYLMVLKKRDWRVIHC